MLHFDGYGEFGRRCGTCDIIHPTSSQRCGNCKRELSKRPAIWCLKERKATSAATWVRADQIAAALVDSRIRLAVINACSSSKIGGRMASDSVVSHLVLTGVTGAIGMQSTVDARPAAKFVVQFYRHFTMGGLSLVDAIAKSRHALLGSFAWSAASCLFAGQ